MERSIQGTCMLKTRNLDFKIPIKMAKIKKTDNTKIWQVGGATKISYIVGTSVKCTTWKKVWWCLIKVNVHLSYYSVIPPKRNKYVC